jgi:hypothetical protein
MIEDSSPEKEEQRAHDAFIRWQDLRHIQFGYVVSLLLTLATAVLGYGVNLLVSMKIKSDPGKKILDRSLVILGVSVGFGLVTTYSRLLDLRETAKSARNRELMARATREKDSDEEVLRQAERDRARANAALGEMLLALARLPRGNVFRGCCRTRLRHLVPFLSRSLRLST